MIYLIWLMDFPHIIPLSPTIPHFFQTIWPQGKTHNCAVGHIVHCSTQYLLEVLPHLEQSIHCHRLHYLWLIKCPYLSIIRISPSYNTPFQTSIHLIQVYQGPSYQYPHHQHYSNTKYTTVLYKSPQVYNIDTSFVSTHWIPPWIFLISEGSHKLVTSPIMIMLTVL